MKGIRWWDMPRQMVEIEPMYRAQQKRRDYIHYSPPHHSNEFLQGAYLSPQARHKFHYKSLKEIIRWTNETWRDEAFVDETCHDRNRTNVTLFTTYLSSIARQYHSRHHVEYSLHVPHCSTRSETPQESRLAGGEGLPWCRQQQQSQQGYWWTRAWKGSWWKVCQMMLDFALAAKKGTNSLINSLCSCEWMKAAVLFLDRAVSFPLRHTPGSMVFTTYLVSRYIFRKVGRYSL